MKVLDLGLNAVNVSFLIKLTNNSLGLVMIKNRNEKNVIIDKKATRTHTHISSKSCIFHLNCRCGVLLFKYFSKQEHVLIN